MNDLPLPPSRLLRATAFVARWLMGLLLAAWLVVVVAWGILHGWIVPRIAEFRPQLEQQASRMLGLPVRIGDISAQTVGLVPSFALHDITFHGPDGQVALRLPSVMVALSPRSLLQRGFEQLYIDRPELDIRRAADGRIFIAGLDFGQSQRPDNGLQKWFFSQREFVIHQGQVRWTDEQRGAPALALTAMNVVVRNTVRRHAVHVDAQAPPAWGSHFSVNARFLQPLLSRNTGDWRQWDGQVFAQFDRVDVSRLRQYADLGLEVNQGNGALRLWSDLRRGQVVSGTADVALAQVSVSLGADQTPLTLRSMTGRLGGKRLPKGFELSTQNLQFQMQDGRHWPGGNVAVVWKDGDAEGGSTPSQAEFHADRLDLAALGQMSSVLPLGTATHATFKSLAPQGLLEKVDGHWQGGKGKATKFDLRGRVSDLSLASEAAKASPLTPSQAATEVPRPGRPGLTGATVDFDLTQAGGSARLAVHQGQLSFPGVFDDPVVKIDQLSAELMWQQQADKLAVQVNRLRFANADGEGEAQIGWRTSDPARSSAHARFPGVLDLQGSLSRADATRVHRYLPLVLPVNVRDYVKASVLQGRASGVKFRVKGDLHDMPFRAPNQGEFRISTTVQDALFDFVPLKANLKWPALTQLNGELVFDRTSMQVRGASAKVDGLPGLQITKAEAQIPDLAQGVLQVNGEARGPASEVLSLLAASPVSEWTSHALDQASTTGNADYRLNLTLPLRELEKSKVQGSAQLANNDFQLHRDSPRFSRGRGTVTFTETGFTLQAVQAGWLGGEVRLDGGTQRATTANANAPGRTNEPSLLFRAQGTATAEGLQQSRDIGLLSRLAHNTSGTTSYSGTLAVRRGLPEITVQSNLQGLALHLPPPLNKAADAVMPMRFENTLVLTTVGPATAPQQDQIMLDLGPLGSAMYVRDISKAEPRVVRGGIGVGLLPGEAVPLPNEGVAANLNLEDVNVDAWQAVLNHASGGISTGISTGASGGMAGNPPASAPQKAAASEQDYLPTVLAVRAKALTVDGHRLQNLVVGGSRDGLTWRTNLEADELSGYLEYRQSAGSSPGRLYARLARLVIAPSAATQVEALLSGQPSSLPTLDIEVDDLDLRGKKLGRVDIEAANRGVRVPGRDGAVAESGRDWRLNKFNITVPGGKFSAMGNWAEAETGKSPADARRTVMNFQLDIADAGLLLAHFGMKDVVRYGHGKLEGQVGWVGSPLAFDYPTLDGQFNVSVDTGQFLKADPGLAKLLSVLSLQSLPRRLALDFRDVFSEGFAFDFLRGDVRINRGIAFTNNLQMKGVNAAVLMEGRADIARETQDVKVVVVPEINAGTASLVASVINPVVGLTTFLTQLLLRRPMIEAATQEFHIDGSWADPRIVKLTHNRGTPEPAPAETTIDKAAEESAVKPEKKP